MTQFQATISGSSMTGTPGWNSNWTLGSLTIADPFNSANAQTCNYTHDDLARLGNVNCGMGKWNQAFSYDAFGNISKTGTGTGLSFVPTYTSSTNRYATLPSGTPAYDANGNLTNDSFHTYTWDSDANLATLGSSTTLTSDALDRRIEQTTSGTSTEILYGPDGSKLALMNGASVVKVFAPLSAGATAVYTSSGLAYYRHPDWLGSSRLASTPSRTVYYDGAYAPFGENYAETGTTDRNFTGQNQDLATDLYDFLYREYHPTQGRWIQPDPAGLNVIDSTNPQTWNRYGYAEQSPLGAVDPFGLSDIVFNGADHTITVFADIYDELGDREPYGAQFCATNSAIINGKEGTLGEIPNGVYPFLDTTTPRHHDPASDSSNGRFGPGGIFRVQDFNYHGPHTGIGLHAGRADQGGCSCPTYGCVRTVETAISYITWLAKSDPLRNLIVVNNRPSGGGGTNFSMTLGPGANYNEFGWISIWLGMIADSPLHTITLGPKQ